MTVKRLKFAAAVRNPMDSCRRTPCGVTLIEVMVAMAILVIAALGALGYQYHATAQARIARAQITATRTAQLLLEDWKSTSDSTSYDPSALELGFSSPQSIPGDCDFGPDTGTILNNAVYAITVDDVPMLVMLTWANKDYDPTAKVTLRELTVKVKWNEKADTPPLILTTYVAL